MLSLLRQKNVYLGEKFSSERFPARRVGRESKTGLYLEADEMIGSVRYKSRTCKVSKGAKHFLRELRALISMHGTRKEWPR